MPDRRTTRADTTSVKKDQSDEMPQAEAMPRAEQQQQISEQKVFETVENRDIMEKLSLFMNQTNQSLQELRKQMEHSEAVQNQRMENFEAVQNQPQKSLTIRVKEEVDEATKDVVSQLEERQEDMKDEMEKNWDAKLKKMDALCEDRNRQHVDFLEKQAKQNGESIEKHIQEQEVEMVRLEHSIEEQREEIKKLKGRRVPEREGSEEEQEEEEDNMHNDTIQEFPDRYQRRGRGRERTRPDRARRQATANQQKMNVSKIISTLPQFSGKAGTWESFISTFTAVTRKLEINDNEKLDFLLISFRNEAAEFKDLLPETVRQNYDEVVRRCSERFGKKEDEITTRRQLAAIKQYVDESVDQFAERIERLVRQAFPTATEDIANAMAVDAFIKGCSNKRAALMVADQDPQP